ncbi:substrate-binding domain-containing protein [Halopenitus sp. H-Gu1]|uniref:substrate-binding domain-containing protein n=1 Tax=Halopenitus sp. H-Gu1 TaxID=3242697 RepID=UPI00359E87C6
MGDRLPHGLESRRDFLRYASAAGLSIGVAGCSGNGNGGGDSGSGNGGDSGSGNGGDSSGDGGSGSDSGSNSPYSAENQEIVDNIDPKSLEPDELIGIGSKGFEPSSPETVELSDAQLQEIEEMDAQTAIVFHYLKTAWVRLQRKGLTERFEDIGFSLEGVYGSEFDAEKQANIVETLAGKGSVDAITSRPLDANTTSGAFKTAADAGKDLVFMDDIPSGLNHPDDFASMVAADNRALGVIGGHVMAEFVGEGDIIMIGFGQAVKSVDERESGFRETIEQYDGINIVEQVDFNDANKVQNKAANLMTANPQAKGLWAPWDDPPGMQCVAAAKEQGKDPQEFHITTCDLGERSAQNMAEGGYIKGIGSQRPYDQGVSEANAIAQAVLGNETPPYIGVPALAVTRKNLLSAYEAVFKESPPEKLENQFN